MKTIAYSNWFHYSYKTLRGNKKHDIAIEIPKRNILKVQIRLVR